MIIVSYLTTSFILAPLDTFNIVLNLKNAREKLIMYLKSRITITSVTFNIITKIHNKLMILNQVFLLIIIGVNIG